MLRTALSAPARALADSPASRPCATHLAAFGLAYLAGAGIAKILAILPESGISMWPPSGIYMATLILASRAGWPWWMACALAAELVANLALFGNPLPVALGIHLGNAAEAVAGALLVRAATGGTVRLATLGEVMALVVLGAVVAPLASATFGAATLAAAGGQSFLAAFPLFWVGDGTGVVVFAPLVFFLAGRGYRGRPLSPVHGVEIVLLLAALVAVGVLAMHGDMPFAYAVLPLLIWTAVRFPVAGAALMPPVLALLAAVLALPAMGLSPDDPLHRHLVVQGFLAISAVSALAVGALARQHQAAVEDLRATNEALETRVAERAAVHAEGERRLSALLEALPLGVAMIDRHGDPVVANGTYARYVPRRPPSMSEGGPARWEAHDPDGRRLPPERFPARRALAGETVWPGQDFLYSGDPSRAPYWVRVSAVPFRDPAGAVAGAILVIEDVDVETRTAEELRLGEERLRIAHEAAELGTWDLDNLTGRVVLSPRARRLAGIPLDEPATAGGLLARVHPDDRPALLAEIARTEAVRGADAYRADYRVVLPDGTERWLEDRGKVMRDGEGSAIRTIGVVRDVTERRRAEQQADLLVREVHHRSKNLLALVQVIARRTAAGDPETFVARFEERMRALADSHDLLVRRGWRGVGMDELVRTQLAHLADLLGSRISVEGPPLDVGVEAAQTLAIAVHELATNAAKHGALSTPEGRIRIRWEAAPRENRFAVRWVEEGGPQVSPPARKGFGSRVLERMSKLSLDAETELLFLPGGIEWRLSCDLGRVAPDRRDGEVDRLAPEPTEPAPARAVTTA